MRAVRQSDQPGRDPARAGRQCVEPGAAAARRRAADRSVRRLDQLAGLRSLAAGLGARDARRRQRRQRTRRAGRHDRAQQRGARRTARRSAAALAYGSRDSLDAHAGFGMDLGAGFVTLSGVYARGDGFVPSSRSNAARSIAPRPTNRRAWRFARSRRSRRMSSSRPTASGFATNASAAPRSATSAPTAPMPRCDWSQAGAGPGRRCSMSRPATSTTALPASLRIGPASAVSPSNIPCHRPDLAGASSCGRRSVATASCGWAGTGAKTMGETRERFNFQNGIGTRSRVAGGRTRTIGVFAEAALVRGPRHLDRRRPDSTAGGSKTASSTSGCSRPAQMLTDVDFADRSGWEPTARAGIACRPAGAVTLRAAAYLGWRLPTLNELYRPFRVGADATAANAALAPERLKGVEAGAEYRPISTARVGFTAVCQPAERRHRQRHPGTGPGIFPGVGFVAAGGEYRQRRNLEAIDARGIEIDGSFAFGAWSLSGGYSYVDAEVQANGRGRGRWTGCGRRKLRGTASLRTLAWSGVTGARAAFTARYTGNQFEDDLNQQLLPDALIFDASASLPLTPAIIAGGARGKFGRQARRGRHQRQRHYRAGDAADFVGRASLAPVATDSGAAPARRRASLRTPACRRGCSTAAQPEPNPHLPAPCARSRPICRR